MIVSWVDLWVVERSLILYDLLKLCHELRILKKNKQLSFLLRIIRTLLYGKFLDDRFEFPFLQIAPEVPELHSW